MADKAHRLHFTEDELDHRDIRKAAKKAEKAADKADRANERLPVKRRVRIVRDGGSTEAVDERLSDKLHQSRQSAKADREKDKSPKKRRYASGRDGASGERLSDKLRPERQSAKAARGKLRIEVTQETAKRPGAAGRAAVNAPAAALAVARNTVRDAVGNSGNDNDSNPGGDALQSGESTARTMGNVANNSHYSHKLRQYDKAEKLGRKSDNANVEALYQRERHNAPDAPSNPISKWRQKQELKKRYMEAKAAGRTGASASGAAKGTEKEIGRAHV